MRKTKFNKGTNRKISESRQGWEERDKVERPIRQALGQAFRQARESAGFSRNAMAKLSGMAVATLKKFEDGDYVLRQKLVARGLVNALKNRQFQILIESLTRHLPSVLEQIIPKDSRPPRLG